MSDHKDKELGTLLASYRVSDANQKLLDHIVLAAARTPQRSRWSLAGLFNLAPMKVEFAAFALLALFGFWVGAIAPTSPATTTTVATAAAVPSDSTDLSALIFGATNWNEVTL